MALEVGDIDAALRFYAQFLAFELRGRNGDSGAFLDAGDQFLALSAPRSQEPDGRHLGLVVDSKATVPQSSGGRGPGAGAGRGLRLRDPWGNLIELVDYADVQFSKWPEVLDAMGLDELEKTHEARAELADRSG